MATLIKEHHRSSLVDRGSPLPLFFQVAEDLKRRLREQTYRAGQRFTSVREVAAQYGISFVTAQKAMALLADQQLIRSRPGRGTVVVQTGPEDKPIGQSAGRAVTVQFWVLKALAFRRPLPVC